MTSSEPIQAAEQAGLQIRPSGGLDAGRILSDWLDLTDTPEEACREVTRVLEAALEGARLLG